jgi:hypothetical protein
LERALDLQSVAEAHPAEKGTEGIASKLSTLHFESSDVKCLTDSG